MIVPWMKISPPQTPCGSWRSTAPARQNRRIGQGWQYALASSRSAGRSENHSCGFSRWQGSGSSSAFACLASRTRELTMMRYRPGSGAVGVCPPDRVRPAPGRLRRAIRWARTMSGSHASAVSGSCRPLADPRWRLAFCICFISPSFPIGLAVGADVIDVGWVRELKVTKAWHAGRHPKVDMPGGIFCGGEGTEVPSRIPARPCAITGGIPGQVGMWLSRSSRPHQRRPPNELALPRLIRHRVPDRGVEPVPDIDRRDRQQQRRELLLVVVVSGGVPERRRGRRRSGPRAESRTRRAPARRVRRR